nr:immunoglobulin light chain junction region [Mus musculus]NSM01472.1 immunoglobulin light chain junction region [Mus musculus]
CQQSNEDPWTF